MAGDHQSDPPNQPDNSESASSSKQQGSASGDATTPQRLGSITRGRGAAKPRFSGRRSATARAELEREAAQKKAEEARVAQAEARENARKPTRSSRGGRVEERGAWEGGRGRGRGRGGFMGEQLIASGPFSAGQVSRDVKNPWKRPSQRAGDGKSGSGGGGGGGRSGKTETIGNGVESVPRASTSKRKSNVKQEPEVGDVVMGGTGSIKVEDGGYISTDDDDETEGGMPRVNIDDLQSRFIDLTENDDAMAPVRLTRYPHQSRALGLAISNESGQGTYYSRDRTSASGPSEKKRGKQRTRDVEITGMSEAPTRPRTYSSSSDTDAEIEIKAEPMEDDRSMQSVAEARPTGGRGQRAAARSQSASLPNPPSSPESKRKAKDIVKNAIDHDNSHGFRRPEAPKLYTDAEKLEWDLLVQDRWMVFDELGQQVPTFATAPPEEASEADRRAFDAAKRSEATRDDSIYLFQLPPVLPDVVPADELSKHKSAAASHRSAQTGGAERPDQRPLSSSSVQETSAPAADGTILASDSPPEGHIGKLRIHQSGKAYLDYGGFKMELNMGMIKSFPEQVLVVDVPESATASSGPTANSNGSGSTKIKVEDAAPGATTEETSPANTGPGVGKGAVAYSMGLVRGEFVVTPDLDELLKG